MLACADAPATRLLNVADAEPQPARRLAAMVAAAAGGALQQEDVDATCPSLVGRLPWTQDNTLDTGALVELGLHPPTFADTIQQEVDWLLAVAARRGDSSWRLPEWIEATMPDYEAEDACRAAGGVSPSAAE